MKTEAFGGNFESYKKQFFAFNDDYPEIAGIIAPLIDEHTRLDEKLNHIFTINHLRRTKQVVIMKIAAVAFMILWAYPP